MNFAIEIRTRVSLPPPNMFPILGPFALVHVPLLVKQLGLDLLQLQQGQILLPQTLSVRKVPVEGLLCLAKIPAQALEQPLLREDFPSCSPLVNAHGLGC